MSGIKDNPPPITEPTKRAGHEIEKGWPHLKAAPLAVASVAVISFLMGFLLAWNIVVAGKNTTIETLNTAAGTKDKTIERLDKENDKLQRQNLELKTALAEFVAPLKKRTLILTSQLNEFAHQWQTNSNHWPLYQDFENRFEKRIFTIDSELDEAGQHSEILQTALRYIFENRDSPVFLTNLATASKELERLANNLKE